MAFENLNSGIQEVDNPNDNPQETPQVYLGEMVDGRRVYLYPDGHTEAVEPMTGERVQAAPGSPEDAASYERITGTQVRRPAYLGRSLNGVTDIFLHPDGHTVAVNIVTGESAQVSSPSQDGAQAYEIIAGEQQANQQEIQK